TNHHTNKYQLSGYFKWIKKTSTIDTLKLSVLFVLKNQFMPFQEFILLLCLLLIYMKLMRNRISVWNKTYRILSFYLLTHQKALSLRFSS
ncbi:hypothetical protein MXB_5376, partial [Myxobolus squamalis]